MPRHRLMDADAAPDSRSARGRGRWTLSFIAAVGVLAAAWAVTDHTGALLPLATPTSGNLLANGSFELPAPGGGMRIYGRTWSRWETIQQWFRLNWPPRRQLVAPMAPPELPGWRIVRGPWTSSGQATGSRRPGRARTAWFWWAAPARQASSRAFSPRPGQEYVFTGWLAHNPVLGSPHGRADVSVNRQFLIQLVHHDPKATRRSMRWRRFSHRFRATSSRTTLTLKDVTGSSSLCGTVLYGLAVTPVPSSPPAR
jgi:hypothetical protein